MLAVFQFLTTVLLMTTTEPVPTATKDMSWRTENVSGTNSTIKDLPISDVRLGTGTIKFVLNALQDGLWLTLDVFQLMIIVLNMMIVEHAPNVSRAIFWVVDNVCYPILFVNRLMEMETVLDVILDTFCTRRTVPHSLSSLTLLYITLNAAQRSSNNWRMKEELDKIIILIYLNRYEGFKYISVLS